MGTGLETHTWLTIFRPTRGGSAGARGALHGLAGGARARRDRHAFGDTIKMVSLSSKGAEGEGCAADAGGAGLGSARPAPKRRCVHADGLAAHAGAAALAAVPARVSRSTSRGCGTGYFARTRSGNAVQLLSWPAAGADAAYHHGVELETLLAAAVRPVFFRVDAQNRCDFEERPAARHGRSCARSTHHYAGSTRT